MLLQLDKQAVLFQTGGQCAKQVTTTEESELAGLDKKYPDLSNFFDLKFVDTNTPYPSSST